MGIVFLLNNYKKCVYILLKCLNLEIHEGFSFGDHYFADDACI